MLGQTGVNGNRGEYCRVKLEATETRRSDVASGSAATTTAMPSLGDFSNQHVNARLGQLLSLEISGRIALLVAWWARITTCCTIAGATLLGAVRF